MLTNVEQANKEAERAYWWLKGIDADNAKQLGVLSKIQEVMSLLHTVDGITMDIVITIKRKSEQ